MGGKLNFLFKFSMALGPGWKLETVIKIALEELQNPSKPLFSRDSSHVGSFSQCAM